MEKKNIELIIEHINEINSMKKDKTRVISGSIIQMLNKNEELIPRGINILHELSQEETRKILDYIDMSASSDELDNDYYALLFSDGIEFLDKGQLHELGLLNREARDLYDSYRPSNLN